MPRYDYILFDADNTLFDFDQAEHRALCQVLTAWGYPADGETCAKYYAVNRDLWARFDRGEVTKEFLVVERFAVLMRALGGSGDPAALNRAYIARLGEGADLLPGAEELCRTLAGHCTLAIITNGVSAAQHGRFERSPLREIIPYLFISEELGCQKPQREFFEIVLREMQIKDPARAVVVGDNLRSDIGGGRNAGLDTIWYNPGHAPAAPDQAPTWEVDSFSAIAHILLDCEHDF